MDLWPREDGDLSEFLRWLTLAHAQRWHAFHGTAGTGHLYQGRFKSFPVQTDVHFLTVCRYVERNAHRAGLARQAKYWRWSSLRYSAHESAVQAMLACDWPVARPADSLERVIEREEEALVQTMRHAMKRRPLFFRSFLRSATPSSHNSRCGRNGPTNSA